MELINLYNIIFDENQNVVHHSLNAKEMKKFLVEIRNIFESHWGKFDLKWMGSGALIILIAIVTSEICSFGISAIFCGIAGLTIFWGHDTLIPFGTQAIIGICLIVAVTIYLGHVIVQNPKRNLTPILAGFFILALHCLGFFSNSFVVYENFVSRFLFATAATILALNLVFVECEKEKKWKIVWKVFIY